MSKSIFVLFIILLSNPVKAQWTGSTTVNGTISRNGNLGIGVSAPSFKLEIQNQLGEADNLLRLKVADALTDQLRFANATGTANQFIPVMEGYHDSDPRTSLFLVGATSSTNDLSGNVNPLLVFDARLVNGSVVNRPLFSWRSYTDDKMTMLANGNLGIGTTEPASKLEINGDISLARFHKIKFLETVNGGDRAYIRSTNGENGDYNSLIFAVGGGNESLKIKYDGKVGIGTDNPSKMLDVNNATLEESFKLTTGTDGRIITFRGETINFKRAGSNYIAASSTSGSLNFSTGGTDIYTSQIRMRITSAGNVGIGTLTTGSHRLAVEGSIGTRKIVVESTGWSDFVFEKDYELQPLEKVEKYISENKHLPEIPSAQEVKKNGIDLGQMDTKLLQKVEELTLYLIEQNKQNKAQQLRIERLEKELKLLKGN